MTQLHRVLGYCGTLVLHMGNGLAMLLALEGDIMKNPDPDLKRFHMMQYRYITIWNLIFQSTYAALSLACELYDYLKLTQYIEFRQRLEQFRNSYFCAIVWPLTVSIFIFFWPMYIYDRDLIFPSYIDKVLSQVSNQVMHTAIIPVVLWEITYNQRKPPKSHGENFNIFSQLIGTYYVALFFTHWQLAAWPYPIFNYMSFPQIAIFLLFLWVASWGTYYLQWSLAPIMANLVKKKSE